MQETHNKQLTMLPSESVMCKINRKSRTLYRVRVCHDVKSSIDFFPYGINFHDIFIDFQSRFFFRLYTIWNHFTTAIFLLLFSLLNWSKLKLMKVSIGIGNFINNISYVFHYFIWNVQKLLCRDEVTAGDISDNRYEFWRYRTFSLTN